MCCRVQNFCRYIRLRSAAYSFGVIGLIVSAIFLTIEVLELMDESYHSIRQSGLAGVTYSIKLFLMFEIGMNTMNIIGHCTLLLGIALVIIKSSVL
jgi:hypothetical protein